MPLQGISDPRAQTDLWQFPGLWLFKAEIQGPHTVFLLCSPPNPRHLAVMLPASLAQKTVTSVALKSQRCFPGTLKAGGKLG